MTDDQSRLSFSDSLVLDDCDSGVVIAGIKNDTVAAKSGLKTGDEIVAATIRLKDYPKEDVLNILKALEPYQSNTNIVTKNRASLDSLGFGLDSAEMLRSKDLSLDASAKAPEVSLNGMNGELNAGHDLGSKMDGPTVNGELPSLSLNKTSPDGSTTFKLPSAGLKGSDLSGGLKSPDVSVSAPKGNTPNASLDIKKPDMKTKKYAAPKFTMPSFGNTPAVSGDLALPTVNSTDLNLSAPDFNFNGPGVDLDGPDIKTSKADLEAPSGKFKLADLKIKSPNVKGSDANINVDLPDGSLNAPKINADLSAPDAEVRMPTADLKRPNIDAQKPDVDISGSKIKWPHLKWKKPKLHSPNGDLDIDAPDVNVKGPDMKVDAPSNKLNLPHLQWRKGKVKGPNVDCDIDADINKPDLSLSPLKIEGDFDAPTADLKGPDADLDIDRPTGKFNWFNRKLKKNKDLKADIDADVSTPNVDVSCPKIEGDIDVPTADLKGPDADLNVEPSSGKFNWFNWKLKKNKGPKDEIDADVSTPDVDVSCPKIEADIAGPDVDIEPHSRKMKVPTLRKPKVKQNVSADVSGPDAKLDLNSPDFDIDRTNGKSKWFNFKKPTFGTLKGPKADGSLDLPTVDGDLKSSNIELPLPDANAELFKADLTAPDVNVKASDLKLSAPQIEGDLNSLDLDLSLPDTGLKGPDANFKRPDTKFKLPAINMPKIKGPDLSLSDIDTDLPSADLTRPSVNVKTPDLNLPTTKVEGDLNSLDLDTISPDIGLKGPDADFKHPGTKFKLPTINMPKIKGPDLSLSDIDADLPSADLKRPDVKVKTPNLSLPAAKVEGDLDADFGLSTPNADLKGLDLEIPEADKKLKLKGFKLPKLNRPNIDTDLKNPTLDLPLSSADLTRPDVNVKTPDLSLPATKVEGELDADFGLSTPNADLKGLDLEIPEADKKLKLKGFKLPKLNRPNIDTDLKNPTLDLPLSSADLTRPDIKVKTPDLSLPATKVEGDLDTDFGLSTPNADLKGPGLEISEPGKFKMPKLKLPKLKGPKADAAGLDVSLPDSNLNLKSQSLSVSTPKLEGDLSGPNIDTKLSAAELETPDINLPKIGNAQLKTPQIESHSGGITIPDLSGSDVQIPNINTSAEVNLTEPGVDVKAPNVDASLEKPKTHLKFPKFNIFKSKTAEANLEEESRVDTDIEVANAEIPAFKVHNLPRSNINGIGDIDDLLGSSRLEEEVKDYVISKGIKLPILNSTPNAQGKIDIMERLKLAKEKAPSVNATSTNMNLQLAPPSLDMNASAEAGDSALVRGSTFIVEKPASGLNLVAPDISTSDENDKLSLGLNNMLGLIKD
ncbi:uncharacterized protein KZ484_011600 [Pholidichthys leucotaenia]